jgi:hypothetical protein
VFFLSVLAFPLPNFIERAAEIETGRFNQKWAKFLVLKPGIYCFRVIYYLVINIALIPLYIFSIITLKELSIFLYYLIYRVLVFLKFGRGKSL